MMGALGAVGTAGDAVATVMCSHAAAEAWKLASPLYMARNEYDPVPSGPVDLEPGTAPSSSFTVWVHPAGPLQSPVAKKL
jgi:hypothetical protein